MLFTFSNVLYIPNIFMITLRIKEKLEESL